MRMNNSPFYPCSAEDPYGYGPWPGLLGHGQSPDPSLSAFRRDVSVVRVPLGGTYATDNLTAARYLVQQLKTNPDLTSDERVQMLIWLREALAALRTASGTISQSELGQLYRDAKGIPGVGDLVDATASPSSLPGTLAAGAGTLHAAALRAPVSDVLGLPPDVQKRFLQWANKGGNQGIKSARKNFGNAIKITKVEGKFVFEIPASESAKSFIIRGQAADRMIRIPAYRALAQDALHTKVPMSVEGYGATRIGGMLTSIKVGTALAFGPQMILDAIDSHSFGQWLSLEAHNQPANAAAWGVAIVVTAAGTALAISAPIVIAGGLVLGAGAAIVVSMSGAGKWMGDHIDEWRGYHP
jgi:hypothetical protein